MAWPEYLQWGVELAAVFALISLIYLILTTFRFGTRTHHAKAAGKPLQGVLYAFGAGMMPWEKESARMHLPTYLAGVLYHLAIFAALIFLVSRWLEGQLPPAFILALRLIWIIGLVSGLGLLLKRILKPYMRGISTADDFISNLLVNIFILAALIDSLQPDAGILFPILAIILFLYIPIGKIRHCFFFFYGRIVFGAFFGRRGVLPGGARKS